MEDAAITVTSSIATASEIIRYYRFQIDHTINADRALTFHCERKIISGVDVISTKEQPSIVRDLANVSSEIINITDPSTNLPVSISVAGLIAAINNRYAAWFAESQA